MVNPLPLVLLLLPLVKLQVAPESCRECGQIKVCYDGNTGLTSDDAQCIVDYGCEQSFRSDACGICAIDATKDVSVFKDCTGKCFTMETFAYMLREDACGDCGGHGDKCDPEVQTVSPGLLPNNEKVVLSLTGRGFLTPGIEILVLASSKEIIQKATGMKIESGSSMHADVTNLAKGTYIIGARTGPTGTEHESKTSPTINVYDVDGFKVDDISPKSYDVNIHTGKLNVSLHVTTVENLRQFADTMSCLIGSEAIAANFEAITSTLRCEMNAPGRSSALEVCASLNGIHSIGCMTLTVYFPAPIVLHQNGIVFSAKADQMMITFNFPVVTTDSTNCSTYFESVQGFDRGAECTWSSDAKQLTVTLGAGATVGPESVLTLKPGLKVDNVDYPRETDTISLTTLTSEVQPIVIAPRTLWPSSLSQFAQNPVTLGIKIVFAPGERLPASIVWTVNSEIQDKSNNMLELNVDVTNVGKYDVKVVVTDVFGRSAELSHTITKLQAMLPAVEFRPMTGLRVLPDSSFETHPNTNFAIGTRVSYVETAYSSLKNFTFKWYKNGEAIAEGFSYRSRRSEVTTALCGESVMFNLRVNEIDEPSVFIDNMIAVHVVCRDPVAKIAGSSRVEVPKEPIFRVGIDGETHSYDPDGGVLTYNWTCRVLVFSNTRDCIRDFRLRSDATNPWLRFSSERFITNMDRVHVFTLTVAVVKGNRTLSAVSTVEFIPRDTRQPWVRWITLKQAYRHNEAVPLRAYVGLKTLVEWGFVPEQSRYSWVNASSLDVKQGQALSQGVAGYTVKPGVLVPGEHYLMEVKVTNTSRPSEMTLSRFEIYIYHPLSSCTIQAETLTELERTSLTLQGCMYDHGQDDVELQTACMLGNKNVTLNNELTFIVPTFTNRGTTTAKFICQIKDSLGHAMTAESNVVNVILQEFATLKQKTEDSISQLEKEGNTVDAVEIMADTVREPNDLNDEHETQQSRIMEGLKDVIASKPTAREVQRMLKVINKLQIETIKKPKETISLASNINTMLATLCAEPDSGLSDQDLKGLISRATMIAEQERSTSRMFRDIQDRIACIKIKRLALEENDEIVMTKDMDQRVTNDNNTDGVKYRYLVGSLDKVREKGVPVDFPPELFYRDQWSCRQGAMCEGVGLKVEEYDQDPPDLQTGRTDRECSKYIYVDLYNPNTGLRLSTHGLDEPIRINIGDSCPRAQCYFWERAVGKFDQSGVYTTKDNNGNTVCLTSHLSAFTVKSEHVGEDGLNLVMILGLVLGTLLFVTSSVILIRAFCIVKGKRLAAVDKDIGVEYERTY